MRVLICGDRHWYDRKMIFRLMQSELAQNDTVITGGAPGADTIAMNCAFLLKINVEVIMAQWRTYGPRAGPMRNQEMIDMLPNQVWAFHDDIDNSKGTKDLVARARNRLIPVNILTHERVKV